MRSFSKVAVALTVSLMVTSGAAMATPAPVVKGDPQAWAEIETALLKLTHVRSYRVKGWLSGILGGAVEVANPDRVHIVYVGGGGFLEEIQVGNDMCIRGSLGSPSGGFVWQYGRALFNRPGPIDFLVLLSMYPPSMPKVTTARGSAAVIDGVPTRSYTYKFESENGDPLSAEVRLFVADATGLPTRIQWLGDQAEVVMQADFSDYDAPITIELPACRAGI